MSRSKNPASLRDFCQGDYTLCPVYKADKDATFENRRRQFDREMERSTPKADR